MQLAVLGSDNIKAGSFLFCESHWVGFFCES